jgi:phosphate starvation-inducible PhoH-like protein
MPLNHPGIVLEPADNIRLANLCGQFDEHLRQIERRLDIK